MKNSSTGMYATLKELYRNYGGWKALLTSSYFHIGLVLTALSWRSAINESWVDTTKTVLPTLTAFTIAAFAIFFAVLSEKDREALNAPSKDPGVPAPLPVLASSISHAAVVQVLAILFAVVYSNKPFPMIVGLEWAGISINIVLSFIGIMLFTYGVVLLIASILSIFRIIEIKSRIRRSPGTGDRPPPANNPSTPVILDGEEQPPSTSRGAIH